MARRLRLLIISFTLACFCSANEYLAVSDHQWPPFSLFDETGSGDPTETPVTSKPATTTEVLHCQNGGTFNGSHCLCRPEYSGKLCQNLETFQPEYVNRSVEVVAEIDVPYDEDFADEETDRYKEFAKNFTERMDPYYRKTLENLKEVIVIAISRGSPLARMQLTKSKQEVPLLDETLPKSVVVDHEVVLAMPNNATADGLYESNVDVLKDATTALVDCEECPYVAVTAPDVAEKELDIQSICRFDPELGFSFQAVSHDGKVDCVTECDVRHNKTKICYNGGKCNMVKNVGPLCQCPDPQSTWYLGDSCSSPIDRQNFYIGLSVTLACLVVTVGAMAAYVLIYKRRRNQKKDAKGKLVKEWLNEDFEWSRSNSAMNTHDTVERNAPSLPGPSHPYNTNSGDSRRSIPLYDLNRPSQMRIPAMPHAAPHLDPASSASPYNNFSLDRQIRINRPQIRESWDD